MKDKIHLIAEIGTNHNGDASTARELIHTAVNAGADSVKFQIIHPEGLYLPRFFVGGSYESNPVYKQRFESMLSDNEYRNLAVYAKSCGIPMSASVFDTRGLEILKEINAPYVKIASCDLNNSRFLKDAASLGKKIILSTGMASLQEIEHAINEIIATGNNDLIVMHCISVYPCATKDTNMGFIDVLRTHFELPIGFSDHTESSLAAAVAITKGATWIEKHITLDRSSSGFDHAYAMEPTEFAKYAKDIQNTVEACQLATTKVGRQELEVKSRARRGLYAARDMEPGEKLAIGDVLTLRPEGPLNPDDIENIAGRKLLKRVSQFAPLSLDLLE